MDSLNLGRLALALSLGGVLSATLLELTVARSTPGVMAGYLAFAAFQIAAFTLGILAREDKVGMAACVTSAVLACGSLLVLA